MPPQHPGPSIATRACLVGPPCAPQRGARTADPLGKFALWVTLLAVVLLPVAVQADPTFDETIDFIRRTVEEHGQFRNIAGGGRIRVKLAQVLGRRLRFRTTATDGIPGSLDRVESTEFSLADLDPDATHVRLWYAGDRQAYAVWMTDAGRVSGVRRWQDAHEEMPARTVSSGWIAIDDETQAQALAKALNHAIRLAGGASRSSTADQFFGASPSRRSYPATPVTGSVYHVVSLDDAVALMRFRLENDPGSFSSVAPTAAEVTGLPQLPLNGSPLQVTLPGDGRDFETNVIDVVRFTWPHEASGQSLSALLSESEAFVAAGVSPRDPTVLRCQLIQLPLTAAQLPPLGTQIGANTAVRLWMSIGEPWPAGADGFFWLARKQNGSRTWPVRLATAKKSKEFGPDAVKSAATALGLKPSESLTRLLEDNAKAEKAARKADK
ncbi:MAG: hypothetical protein RLZZ34_76 [Verrucomicrobiota bacterium]